MVTSVSPSTMPPWYCFFCSMGPVMVSIQLMSVLP